MLLIKNSNGHEVPYKSMNFSGGEVHFGLKATKNIDPCTITVYLRSSNDIMELLMATDSLKRAGCRDIRLVCPYFPYARQDRVCNPGEALSLKVMADLVNSQGYTSVEVWDAHSDVTPALLNSVRNIHQSEWTKNFRTIYPVVEVIVAPDSGAIKKASLVSTQLGTTLVVAQKHRDTQTGAITGTSVTDFKEFVNENSHLIVDDICDGGRTFIELAKAIRKTRQPSWVGLYVTHGIFSNGFDELRKYVDHIYTANIWPDRYKGNEDYVTVLNRS